MRKALKFLSAAVFTASAGLLATSCNEDTIIPAKVAPGNNLINLIEVPDTFTIISKSLYIDTLRTSAKFDGIRIIRAVGTVVDPYFGKTNAGVYFQVKPSSNDINFSSNPYTIDSAVLVLPYTRFSWGDTTNPQNQKFNVYELTEDLSIDDVYYSNTTKNVDRNNPLASLNVDLKALRASAAVGTMTPPIVGTGNNKDTVGPHLRFKLPQTYIDRVISKVGTSTFQTPANFLAEFKGFYIEPDTNQNTNLMPYFFLDGSEDYTRAAVVFYYHDNATPNEQKTLFFDFDRDECAQFNWVSRAYTPKAKAIFDKYAQTKDQSDPEIILQNLPGAAIDLRIPNIKNMPTGIINKAEIIISLVGSGNANEDSTFWGPVRIDPWGVNPDGTLYSIEDRNYNDQASAISFIGGGSSFGAINGKVVKQYKFNIPKEVQKAIKDKRDELHLRLIGAQGFPAAYRLIAGGETNSTYTVEFHIVYSKTQ
ncbi:MAG: DUF4270 family protein [Flavipsychrobacter sp.]